MDTPAIIVGLIGGAVSLTVAYLGHRRSKVVDAVSAQSGAASNHRAGIEQVIEGSNNLINQLQEENGRLREMVDSRASRLDAMTLEVARLRKKYAANGDNGDTPQPTNKGTQ